MITEIDFTTLIGEKASLYYTSILYSFQLGTVLFEVVEDENDGYRSMMQCVKVVNTTQPKIELLGEVEIRRLNDSVNGFELVDVKDGHVWLQFGTNNIDDYYPSFHYDWNPKPDIKALIK